MHIHKVKISNFKGYFDQQLEFSIPNGRKGSGLNILVGENNTGKSTIFEAISFVRNGVSDISQIVNKNANSSAQVDLTFTGDIKQILESFAQEKKIDTLGKLIYDQNGVGFFQISRNTDEEKKIKVWNESDQSFANPSGIDAVIKGIFELNFVWADTNPNDQAKFGASTVCGKLLKGISTALHDQSEYKAFKESFHKIFNNEDSLLQKQLNIIEEKVQGIFHEQFGNASISFKFNELDSDSFFKNVTIQVDDGISTTLSEKGSGMQRAVFLALLQVYAEDLKKHPELEEIDKPFFLFIDEPEICLHPKAQSKLLDSILELTKHNQIFLTTHSPYFLLGMPLHKIGLFITRKVNNLNRVENINDAEVQLFPWSPTWGEINFYAYDMPTPEFHNELYGYLQEKTECEDQKKLDAYLKNQKIQLTKKWVNESQKTPKEYSVSLQTFIRNKIHHPENTTMQNEGYSIQELKDSINDMINLIKGLSTNNINSSKEIEKAP